MKLLVIGGIVLMVLLLVKTRLAPSMLFFSLISLFYFLGLIKLKNMLENFVNPAVVTLIILMVIMSIVEKTYLVEYIAGLDYVPGKENHQNLELGRARRPAPTNARRGSVMSSVVALHSIHLFYGF